MIVGAGTRQRLCCLSGFGSFKRHCGVPVCGTSCAVKPRERMLVGEVLDGESGLKHCVSRKLPRRHIQSNGKTTVA